MEDDGAPFAPKEKNPWLRKAVFGGAREPERFCPGTETHVAEILRAAPREPDSLHTVSENRTLHRLPPQCCRIGLDEDGAEKKRLRAMGRDPANIHLGSSKARVAVTRDPAAHPGKWLPHAARRRGEATHTDPA